MTRKPALDAPLDELALFGGAPLFPAPLHVGRPNIGDKGRLLARIERAVDTRWLSNGGPLVQEFEAAVARMVGVRHCIAMCNATVALEIAARALDLAGEVIVPSFTFVATAHALQWQEITPVFADVDPHTHNLDPARVERMITPRTTGILAVHVWGRGCEVAALEDIARRHKLRLFFDAAHAFGCSHGGRMIGGFGDCEVFSFHATKFVNSFEGGMVATNDDEIARRIRLMTNFGFADYDNVIYLGINGKMTEASAAMGLTSVEAMEEFIATNRRHYHRYRAALAGLPGLTLVDYDERERMNYQYVVLEIDAARAGAHRDLVHAVLHREGVLARRYFYPGVHQMQPYRSFFPHAGLLLPHTEALCARVLSLPTGTGIDEDSVDEVCALIRYALAHGPGISARLAEARAQSA